MHTNPALMFEFGTKDESCDEGEQNRGSLILGVAGLPLEYVVHTNIYLLNLLITFRTFGLNEDENETGTDGVGRSVYYTFILFAFLESGIQGGERERAPGYWSSVAGPARDR
jgi:hypothetical protein